MEQSCLNGVFSILYDYSMKQKILDEQGIRSIIGIYMYENGLNGLINRVDFQDLGEKSYGYYDIPTRVIYLNLNSMINRVYSHQYSDRFYINCINLINQEVMHSIFHEFNHALRFSIKHNSLGLIEMIMKNATKLSADNKLYETLHDCFPMEKEANFFGYEIIVRLFQGLNNYIDDIYGLNYLYLKYLMTITYGYDMNSFMDNPLKKVILSSKSDCEKLKYGKYLLMKKAIELKNMSLYDRLTFGFPISNDEYSYLLGLLNDVKMYEQDDSLDIKRLILSRK